MKTIINEIQIVPVKPSNGLIAFASFVLFNSIYCSSVGVYTRPTGGYRLVYPTKKIGEGQLNIFYPINSQIGLIIESEVSQCMEKLQINTI